jgi:hypothetical protein
MHVCTEVQTRCTAAAMNCEPLALAVKTLVTAAVASFTTTTTTTAIPSYYCYRLS